MKNLKIHVIVLILLLNSSLTIAEENIKNKTQSLIFSLGCLILVIMVKDQL